MLSKTRGIVLHHIKYGETSIIAHVYTEHFGRRSFMMKGVRSRKKKVGVGMFQPLFALNIEFYNKENRELSLIKEVSPAKNFTGFPYDVAKSAQAMFMAEVLFKTLREEEKNRDLFNFLLHSFEYFDLQEKGASNFHLVFLLKLTRFLGILPADPQKQDDVFFDIKEGIFNNALPLHFDFVDEKLAGLLKKMLQLNYDEASLLHIKRSDRNDLLHEILRFYSFHHFKVDNLNSLEVLKELFR